jgi:hypothetical protein
MAPPVVGFLIVLGVVIALALIARFVPSVWNPVATRVSRVLDIPVGFNLAARESLRELYNRPYPGRLQLNWLALILGPVWYLLVGLWVHASILLTLIFVTGGMLAPIVWLYCGLKADEDLHEFRIARHNVY